jgi:hypothetical protein
MTYILVLVVYANSGINADVAMTNIPGFKTKAGCEAAGAAVKEQLTKLGSRVEAACLKRDNNE